MHSFIIDKLFSLLIYLFKLIYSVLFNFSLLLAKTDYPPLLKLEGLKITKYILKRKIKTIK